jgi:hypothetical protein
VSRILFFGRGVVSLESMVNSVCIYSFTKQWRVGGFMK